MNEPRKQGVSAGTIGLSLIVVVLGWVLFSAALVWLRGANQPGVPVAGAVINTGGYEVLTLNLAAQESRPPQAQITSQPLVAGDLAWGRVTYASSWRGVGYPALATNGSGAAYLSEGSSGTWFYVDLDMQRSIGAIVTTLFLDSRRAYTQYIVSNDLYNWLIVANEQNSILTSEPRTLYLDEPVIARYVGFYARDWGGLQATLTLFAVLPPED